MDPKVQEAFGASLKTVGFEEAQAYLQKSGVYEHVSSVLLKLSTEKPNNALDIFENVSNSVKQHKIVEKSSKSIDEAHEKREVEVVGVL